MDALAQFALLAEYLDAYRGAIAWKVEGLSEEEARRPLVPSGTSALGVVKHLAYVERWWYQAVLARRDVTFLWTEDDPDADWRIEEGETIDSVVALYRQECEESRAIHAGLDPAAEATLRGETLTAYEVVLHMLEETARHAGHMDILREQLDGATGGFPPGGVPWA